MGISCFYPRQYALWVCGLLLLAAVSSPVLAQSSSSIPRFSLPEPALVLERPTHAGAFVGVTGRRAAAFGYENQPFEVWSYPLKLVRDLQLSFSFADSPVAIDGLKAMSGIEVRPEATILTYTHAAFTVRQILFAPLDAPGVMMLLDVQSSKALDISVAFQPDLRLMWPAGLATGQLGWDSEARVYTITEDSQQYAAVIGAPDAQDVTLTPYQDDAVRAPSRFVIRTTPAEASNRYYPVVFAGSVSSLSDAIASYRRMLDDAESLYRTAAEHFRQLIVRTLRIETPDEQLNEAYDWARVAIDKGLVTNPLLGTGMVAGYSTAGNTERPGAAWFFGREALWTSLAISSYGDFRTARRTLEFLRQHQREDGKIPQEISQSASLIPWFDSYAHPWAGADATPLYIIAHAAYFRASGDIAFLRASWPSLLQAYAFTGGTDTDGNGLIENTLFGDGWIEGGHMHPLHEGIYLQGIWAEACNSMAEMADAIDERRIARQAQAQLRRTRMATEAAFWMDETEAYAVATLSSSGDTASPLGSQRIDEITALPAVALWWNHLQPRRAGDYLDYLGSGAFSTDWGVRLVSDQSLHYDPLSLDQGGVSPFHSGWTTMAAYRYGRPHMAFQSLQATASLTSKGALGFIGEQLSGDFNTAPGASTHQFVGASSMVITPLVKGLLGLEVIGAGTALRFAPQLPGGWDEVRIENIPTLRGNYEASVARDGNTLAIAINKMTLGTQEGNLAALALAPSFPADALCDRVLINGAETAFEITRIGDVQQVVVSLVAPPPRLQAVFECSGGTHVHAQLEQTKSGASNEGLRVLRAHASADTLELMVEGLGGQEYPLMVRSTNRFRQVQGVSVEAQEGGSVLRVSFDGPSDAYVRRRIHIPKI